MMPLSRGIPRLTYLGRVLQLCFFPLGAVAVGELRGLAYAATTLTVMVLATLVYRRDIGHHLKQRWVSQWRQQADEDLNRFDDISSAAWIFIGSLISLSLGIFVGLLVGMEHFARTLGAPALLLFALMTWTVIAGFGLTYLPKSFHLPSMAWTVLLSALLLFWRLNENHRVAPPVPSISNGVRAVGIASTRRRVHFRQTCGVAVTSRCRSEGP
jgi:hypothetical protein